MAESLHILLGTSACLQWLCHSGEQTMARGPLVLLTLKAPRKSASENVVCECRLLHLANFSNLHFACRQTVWTQIRLLLKEQSDLGPHFLQQ